MSVLADSNPIEAAVVLRGENLSQSGNGRNSFNSSDSGRMSDTYAETSNSSVTSSTANGSSNGHNRLNSNMSNCSGDSGAQLSLNSNDSKVLEVLKEQDSPDFPPFDQEIYGQSVAIKNTATPNNTEPSNEPRFATVRKSYTLPHGMNNNGSSVASTPTVLSPRKRKDLSQFFGLNDEGPGSPSKEVAQSVAMQNLPQENCNEKIEKYLGINQAQPTPSGPTQASSNKRPRPKSLHGLSLERSLSVERPKAVQSPQAPLSKTLARLQKIKESNVGIKSAPTTPNFPASSGNTDTSPRKRHLARFLGYVTKSDKPAPPLLQAQSNLSKSMDLDSKKDPTEEPEIERNWQSNEGLNTASGSGGLPTPMEPMSPAIKKIMAPSNGLILRVSHRSSSDERQVLPSATSASNSPYHASLGRGKPLHSGVQYHTSSLQRGGLGTITKSSGYPPVKKMMPRSATLDDLEPPSYYEPVMWVQRGPQHGPQHVPQHVPPGSLRGGGCHTCCCSQYRHPMPGTASLNGSLPRYPQHHNEYYDYPMRPPHLPHGPSIMREYRSHSVASADHDQQQVYLSMTRTKRVVVIPINGGVPTPGGPIVPQDPNSSKNVVQIPLRETPVDSDYACMGDPNSKVVSMGNKTCISVNESSLVSTQAIVHQQQK